MYGYRYDIFSKCASANVTMSSHKGINDQLTNFTIEEQSFLVFLRPNSKVSCVGSVLGLFIFNVIIFNRCILAYLLTAKQHLYHFIEGILRM